MDFSVQANPSMLNADRLYQQQRSQTSQTPQASSIGEPNFLKTLMEKEESLQAPPTREAVLSLPEMATLHALFGSERPDDGSFYGKNNNSQIYKGHLLDVAG